MNIAGSTHRMGSSMLWPLLETFQLFSLHAHTFEDNHILHSRLHTLHGLCNAVVIA